MRASKHTIASNSDSKNYDRSKTTELANVICGNLEQPSQMMPREKFLWHSRETDLEKFSNIVNSMRFDFSNKKGLVINVPEIGISIFRHG